MPTCLRKTSSVRGGSHVKDKGAHTESQQRAVRMGGEAEGRQESAPPRQGLSLHL